MDRREFLQLQPSVHSRCRLRRLVQPPHALVQLTLVENDPGATTQVLARLLRRTHSDAACLSAGGCVAYYPTKLPLHWRSPWMKDTDPFGELVAGCRKLNMIVVARTDPHAVHQDVYDAHPTGSPSTRKQEAPPRRLTRFVDHLCARSIQFGFMTEVTRRSCPATRWTASSPTAGRLRHVLLRALPGQFQSSSGLDLPRSRNPQDPRRKAYILWKQQRLFELWRLWDGEIRKIIHKPATSPTRAAARSASWT